MQENEALKAEEIIFYIDLVSDFLKKKAVMKGIKEFIEEKKKFHMDNSFGIVIFQGESNPVNVYDQSDYSSINSVINDSWDSREKKKSYFENGLFEILSYVFGQAQKFSKFYRVIVITDLPSIHSDEYHNALYDLIVKAKNLSTSIDVIRIGKEKFYPDEVKLKVITSETQGGVFFCNDGKHFLDVLGSLIKNRQEFNIVRPGGVSEDAQVMEKDKTFYERLAADLITLETDDEEVGLICQVELCPVCEAHSDELRKCFNCGAAFHSCCAAEYSLTNNIGFKHIFRCPQCETLLKLDEEFVEEVYEESQMGEDYYAASDDDDDDDDYDETATEEGVYVYHSLSEDDAEQVENVVRKEPIIIETEEVVEEVSEEVSPEEPLDTEEAETEPIETGPPSAPPAPPAPPIPEKLKKTKTIKVGGFFGKEIRVEDKSGQTDDNGMKEQIWKAQVEQESAPVPEDKLSITQLRPPRKKGSIKFCKICGSSVKGTLTCSNCGATVD